MTEKNYMSDFQQTVDLRERPEKKRKSPEPLEKIYQPEAEVKKDFSKISQPAAKRDYGRQIRLAVFVLAALVLGLVAYKLFFAQDQTSKVAQSWYAVKLLDGEIFYGQIMDIKADPVVINNVYYDYDQAKAKQAGKAAEETGNLRLVKRGKETHGPDGSLNVVRSQVLFMEPLKADSKVLKAILEYEK
jgi:uncharacterized protein HemX